MAKVNFFNKPPSLREASTNAQRLVREERQGRTKRDKCLPKGIGI
ncbi:hypothetical protein [Nostoc sp.]